MNDSAIIVGKEVLTINSIGERMEKNLGYSYNALSCSQALKIKLVGCEPPETNKPNEEKVQEPNGLLEQLLVMVIKQETLLSDIRSNINIIAERYI